MFFQYQREPCAQALAAWRHPIAGQHFGRHVRQLEPACRRLPACVRATSVATPAASAGSILDRQGDSEACPGADSHARESRPPLRGRILPPPSRCMTLQKRQPTHEENSVDLGYSGISVVVTGAASNIGRAIALGFAAEGARVTIGDIDAEQAGRVADEARALGGQAQAVATDVTDLAQVQRLFAAAEIGARAGQGAGQCGRLGSADVLHRNHARVLGQDHPHQLHRRPELHQDGAGRHAQIRRRGDRVDQFGRQPSGRAARGGVRRRQGGHQQLHEKRSRAKTAALACAATWSVRASPSRTSRAKSARTACGPTRAPCSPTSSWKKSPRRLPLKKIGKPRDIANAVLFLASDRVAGHITGQVLSVSGGYSMAG